MAEETGNKAEEAAKGNANGIAETQPTTIPDEVKKIDDNPEKQNPSMAAPDVNMNGDNANVECSIWEVNDTYASSGMEDVKTTLKILLETVYTSNLPDRTLKASMMDAPNFLRLPMTEVTLALIKPDAVRAGHAHEIRYQIQNHGFIIVAETRVQLTRIRAEEFYEEHNGKSFFNKLTRFMSSGPVHAFILGKTKAVKEWNVLMGNKDPNRAQKESPKSLRARFGTDELQNAVHGSFSTKDARREIKFFFPYYALDPILDEPSAKQYFEKNLKRVLVKGLTALAWAKPSSEDPLKVITWFAKWLETNNPNRPLVNDIKITEP